MHTDLCDRLGIEFPIFAFTHCPRRRGRGCQRRGLRRTRRHRLLPEELEVELEWLNAGSLRFVRGGHPGVALPNTVGMVTGTTTGKTNLWNRELRGELDAPRRRALLRELPEHDHHNLRG